MKTLLIFVAAVIFVSAETYAQMQPLPIKNVTDGIYCRFSPDCHVAPVTGSSSFTPTNLAVTCVLESRSFAGSGMDSKDTYGYEYRLVLNNDGEKGTNFFTVDSLAINFDNPQTFAFGNHAGNRAWVLTDESTNCIAPASLNFSGTNIVVQFVPPLVLATLTNKTVSTCLFGLISTNNPQLTKAIITGSTQTPPDAPAPFEEEMDARTP